MAISYLSRTEVAERIGVKPSALSRYRLPEPDALTGTVRGWLPETIDAWDAERPGRGNWRQPAAEATVDYDDALARGLEILVKHQDPQWDVERQARTVAEFTDPVMPLEERAKMVATLWNGRHRSRIALAPASLTIAETAAGIIDVVLPRSADT